jgi:hypothetical protein
VSETEALFGVLRQSADGGCATAIEGAVANAAADLQLARQWREAKQRSPALTKEEFLVDLFGWKRVARNPDLHWIEVETIREYLERLDEGEKQLTASEGG